MSRTTLTEKFNALEAEWNTSAQKQAIINILNKRVFAVKDLEINSAVCLGLGTFIQPYDQAIAYPGIMGSSGDESEAEDDEEGFLTGGSNLADGRTPRNNPLYQLLIFSEVLRILRERFPSFQGKARFQDPDFIPRDVVFLQSRGHEVIPFPPRVPDAPFDPENPEEGRYAMADPALVSSMSEHTFFYAPFLIAPVAIQVLVDVRPQLYLGGNPFHFLISPHMKIPHEGRFREFLATREYRNMDVLGMAWFGFAFPADLTTEIGRDRARERKLEEADRRAEEERRQMEALAARMAERRAAMAARGFKF